MLQDFPEGLDGRPVTIVLGYGAGLYWVAVLLLVAAVVVAVDVAALAVVGVSVVGGGCCASAIGLRMLLQPCLFICYMHVLWCAAGSK